MQYPPLPRTEAAPPALRAESLAPEPWAFEEEGPELREYAQILWKRRWLVGLFAAGVFATAALFTFLQTPVYTAEATLLIEPTDPQVIDIKHVFGESFGYESSYYVTQTEMLRSRSLAAQVIEEHRLAETPAFFEGGPGLVATLAGIALTPIHVIESWLAPPREAGEGDDESWLVDHYLEGLGIEPVPDSRLIRLYYSSADPELAARITNAHARAFIAQGLGLRARANDEARRFLEGRLDELRSRLERAEAALNRYRREKGIVSLDTKANVVVDRLADLNLRLTAAEAERIGAEADFRLAGQRSADSLPAVLESAVVKTLKESLARLEGERASLATRFKPGYPRVAQLDAQIAEVRRRLVQEVRSIAAGIESTYLAAKAREDELRAQLGAQKAAALRLEDAAVEYAILEHDAETARQLYGSVRQRIQETNVAAELRASNVFVIDEAAPPLDSSSPRTGRNLAFALLLGLMGGVGFAFLGEYLDSRLRGPQDVERSVGLASLGVVPDFAPAEAGWPRLAANVRANVRNGRGLLAPPRARPADPIAAEDPPAAVTEAYRAIRTSILLSQAGEPPRTILFTSGSAAEGKTTTVLHMALMFARLGEPVLVIDADLRRPSCHRVLGVRNGPGLTEVLAGHEGRLRRLHVQKTDVYFLGAGSIPPNPTELLGSQRMREVLARLQKRFAFVLIDAPPLGPVSDSVVLSTLVDGVVLVVDQQRTSRQRVRDARARLAWARAKVLGVVLNRSDAEGGAYPYVETLREATA
jgi:capsular exopolysaccharide synthesis family protein